MNKTTKIEAIHLIKKFIKQELSKKPWFLKIKKHVKAIVFYGSTAKETNKPSSDIDILIFVPLSIEKKYTKGEYVYEFEGKEVNIVLRSIERLRKLAKSHDDSEREVFRKSEILFESDDEVKKLIKRI